MEAGNDLSANGKQDAFVSTRKKVIISCLLFFLAGMLGGILLGMFVAPRIVFRFWRPSPENIAHKRAADIQRALGLTDAQRQDIVRANLDHYRTITREFEGTRGRMDVLLKEYADNVAKLIDDPAKRTKWLETYENYFPKGPPRPMGMMPPPPHGPPPPRPPRD